MRVPDLEAMVSEEERRQSRALWWDSLTKTNWLMSNPGVLVQTATPEDLDRLARTTIPQDFVRVLSTGETLTHSYTVRVS